MNNDSFVYSFDLKESLFMEDSQGISEIKHISLDPDISIQAFSDYYSIRGVVILSGEYIQEPLNQATDSLPAFNDFDFKRYIENTIELGDGLAQFTHRFPVEISVPSYRVNDMDDVAVHIASFDYELPSADKLIIDATVQILGIQGEATNLDDTANERKDAVQNEVGEFHEAPAADTFSFEVKNNEDDDLKELENDAGLEQSESLTEQVVNNEEREEQANDIDYFPTLPELREEEGSEIIEETTEEKVDDEKKDEDDRLLFKKKTQSLEEFFAKDKKVEKSSTEESAVTAEAETAMAESQSEAAEVMDESEATDREDFSESEEKPQLHFLSDMIQDEEESFTQMRLCIVQKEDTLESIAERYKTTSLHILKKNRLDDDAVSEGQLLYIPIRKNK